jgi:hypothetical protein
MGRGGAVVLGEVLEDLPKRSEPAGEVGHAGIGDAEEPVLTNRVLEELGDLGGELADRLVGEPPGGDGKAWRAGTEARRDRACAVDVLGFVSGVDRPPFELVDGGVQLLVRIPAKYAPRLPASMIPRPPPVATRKPASLSAFAVCAASR